jgi:hypothetical protein
MKKTFKIVAGYQWEITCSKNGKSMTNLFAKKALRKIVNTVEEHIRERKLDVDLDYARLRGGAGKNLLSSIIKRINESNVAIFDISLPNLNVMLELGIAIARAENDPNFSVYLIRNEKTNYCDEIVDKCKEDFWTLTIPSDLQGYFISLFRYDEGNGNIIFLDNGSLYMSILRDIKSCLLQISEQTFSINESVISNELDSNKIINNSDV